MASKSRVSWFNFAVLATILVVPLLGYVTYRNTALVRKSEFNVRESQVIRESVIQLLSTLKDIELGQRGYLLTSRQEFLEPYSQGSARLEAELRSLERLEPSNADNIQRVERLQQLIQSRLEDLRTTIEIQTRYGISTPSPEALAIVGAGEGKRAMDQIRQTVEQVLLEESERQNDLQAALDETSSANFSWIVVENILAVSMIAFTALAARLDRRRRDVAESELGQKSAEMESLLATATEAVIYCGTDMHIRYMNPAAAANHGCDINWAVSKEVTELFPDHSRHQIRQQLSDFVAGKANVWEFSEGEALRLDGTTFFTEGSWTKSQTAAGNLITLMYRDITTRLADAQKLMEQAAILSQVRDAVIVCDMDDRVISFNQGAQTMYGVEPSWAIGRKIVETLFEGIEAQWKKGSDHLVRHDSYSAELKQLDVKGRELVVEHRRSWMKDGKGNRTGQLILHLDITERKREQANQLRSQRLESIGTLAGGIAHDLNNVLTPILMGGRMIARSGGDHVKMAETIVASAQRGSQMIKKLLAFAGGEHGSFHSLSVTQILLETQELLHHTFPKSIELRVNWTEPLGVVNGNGTELSQVLLNLAVNARDAMANGGVLTIQASGFQSKEVENVGPQKESPFDFVEILVSDTGVGIPDDILDRIFDPFFTTKKQGKGTGLGLATSLGIIRAHGGHITVKSNLGKGTEFRIYLPVSVAEQKQQTPEIATHSTQAHGEAILVVDDELLILQTVREVLENAGHTVYVASSGAEAVRLFKVHKKEIELVLLDMMMPGMDGIETQEQLRKLAPNVRILACSGLRRPTSERESIAEMNGFLAKPYSDEQLLRAIRTVLEQGIS
ncbi:MAG: CHASE3 domain-containing protein [Planctomycetales bacterium]|nr:CHASE3 domain-containing protein [Planctomycetales bacterium]